MPFVLYDDQFPHHPKVVKVKVRDRAALTLHLLCGTWSAATATPGIVTEDATIEQAGSKPRAKKWASVLVDADLWHAPGHDCPRCPQITTGYVVHDWTDNGNIGAEEVARRREEISRKRSAAGAKGAAARWGKRDDGDGKSHAAGMANANSKHGNRGGNGMASDGTSSPSPSPSPVVSSVGDSSSVADARAKPDEDLNSRIENRIIDLLDELTGHVVTPGHAAAIRRQLLGDRPGVTNQLGYVVACIRREPRRYLPAEAADPAARTVAEALGHGVKDPDATERGAAAARAAMRRKP